MSIERIVAQMQQTAAGLRDPRGLVQAAASTFGAHVRSNINKGVVAGEYRPESDVSGTSPGERMSELAPYTIKLRRAAGIQGTAPLKATGQLLRETGYYNLSERSATVGGKTPRARSLLEKHLGTASSGIESTDLKREIPPRSPVGYDKATLAVVIAKLNDKLGADDSIEASGNVSAQVRILVR